MEQKSLRGDAGMPILVRPQSRRRYYSVCALLVELSF
jgi:hypothetical protein